MGSNHSVRDGSILVGVLAALGAVVADAASTSTVVRSVQRVRRGFGVAFRASTLAPTLQWWTRAVSESRLYGWFSGEGVATILVIDLRETYTFGPILGVLHRVSGLLARWYPGSSLSVGHDAIARLWVIAGDAHVVKVVAALLTPPAPPGVDEDETDTEA